MPHLLSSCLDLIGVAVITSTAGYAKPQHAPHQPPPAAAVSAPIDQPDLVEILATVGGTGFQWVNSISASGGARNLRSISGKGVAVAGGYATVGDGGGGMFHWDASSTTGDNDGTIIVPSPNPGGRWVRTYSGAINVRWFGAGLGLGSDSLRLQTILGLATQSGGGVIYFPNGIYSTAGSIGVNGSNIILRGESMSAKIVPAAGSFDTISLNGTLARPLSGIHIENLYLAENNKTGGNSILAQYVSRCAVLDCVIDSPATGVRLHNFNTINVERVRIANPRAANNYGFWITGDNNGGSDVISFKDVVFQGGAPSTHSSHGVIVDGRVSTLSAHKLYCVNADGAGLWFRNTMGTAQNPQFATLYGLEVDFPYLQAVYIQAGQRIYFTDAQMHGSATRANVTIDNGANTISFKGGFSSGAAGAGIDIFGQQVSICGMDVLANSLASQRVYSGIQVNSTARMATITGNKCGDPGTPSQYAGIRVYAGADQFSVVGNAIFNNLLGVVNESGTSVSKVVASNATQ